MDAAAGTLIGDREFAWIREACQRIAGIRLGAEKKPLVCARLGKRVRALQLPDFRSYVRLLEAGGRDGELATAIDLLTTNETYFFREPRHFARLERLAREASAARPFRVWSAACSSGEEPYSVAMVLDDCRSGSPWEVVATDLSSRVLERAAAGHYSLARTDGIPRAYLARYCLKGVGRQSGTLLVERSLRERVSFRQVNLMEPLPPLGEFDVVFLRNVLIYFDVPTKRAVIERVESRIRRGGFLFVGHSESLSGVYGGLPADGPAVYRKP